MNWLPRTPSGSPTPSTRPSVASRERHGGVTPGVTWASRRRHRTITALGAAVRIFFAVPRSAWVDLNLRRSLQDMGHELVRFDFPGWPDDTYPAWTSSGKPRTNERLLKQFRAEHARKPFDLFFGYFYSSVVYPETIDLIR